MDTEKLLRDWYELHKTEDPNHCQEYEEDETTYLEYTFEAFSTAPLIQQGLKVIQSAMNAQERELREALRDAAHVCRQATTFSSPAWKRNALSVIVRAERLLAERGETPR